MNSTYKNNKMVHKTRSRLEMQYVPVDSLQRNPWNPNVVSPENEKRIEASIARFDLFRPIIVRELESGQLEILGGQHRWEAAKRIGYEEVPIINLGRISDEKAKEIGLVDNARYGEDDVIKLDAILKDLSLEEISDYLPYTDADLASIFNASNIALDELDTDAESDLPELPPTPPAPTHQIMRFKVPVEDVAAVTAVIEHVMRAHNFTGDDSMSNAGNALVEITKKYRESLV